jgi:xanthine dehydrogenase YagS FAD-binding subunit
MSPATLIDVSRLKLDAIEASPQGLRIGATARNSDVAEHALVKTAYPLLSEALLAGASPQIRNLATIGGNLMQRTRCAYFRDPGVAACNKRNPGSGCAAMDGWTRMHAILGTSDHCIATHPSDMCVALVALDAAVRVKSTEGERTIAIKDFHLQPGAHPEMETALRQNELIIGILLPKSMEAQRYKSRYVKARDRAAYAFALASCAACLFVDKGIINDARVVLGGVATVPWRSHEAEQALIGKKAERASYEAAASAALAPAKPRTGNQYKVDLAKRVIVRALETVA